MAGQEYGRVTVIGQMYMIVLSSQTCMPSLNTGLAEEKIESIRNGYRGITVRRNPEVRILVTGICKIILNRG